MSYEPPALPVATWREEGVSSHAVDLAAAPTVDDDLVSSRDSPAFCRVFAAGAGRDYDDVRALRCVREAGSDVEGNPLYVFIPGNMAADTDLMRVREFAFQLLKPHLHAGNPFSVIFVQNNVSPEAQDLSVGFVVRTYLMLPRVLKRNLRRIAIVHPTSFVRASMLLLSPFLSDSFWDKLFIVERLEFLDDIVGRGQARLAALELPAAYADWDKHLEEKSREDHEALRTGAMYQAGMGMGGIMGGAVFQGAPMR